MKEPEQYPLPAQFEKELASARSQARIQTAKLKNQLERYDKLASRFEAVESELVGLKEDHQAELDRLTQKHEQALAHKKRQNDLILQQMNELEERAQQVDELAVLRKELSKVQAENELLTQENARLWEEIEWMGADSA